MHRPRIGSAVPLAAFVIAGDALVPCGARTKSRRRKGLTLAARREPCRGDRPSLGTPVKRCRRQASWWQCQWHKRPEGKGKCLRGRGAPSQRRPARSLSGSLRPRRACLLSTSLFHPGARMGYLSRTIVLSIRLIEVNSCCFTFIHMPKCLFNITECSTYNIPVKSLFRNRKKG